MHLLDSDIAEIVDTTPFEFWGQFSGKRVLLTGGRGFLGRYFTEVFARVNRTQLEPNGRAPVELVVLDNLITAGVYGSDAKAHPHVEFVQHDIIQPFTTERRVDFILHAAGIASPYYYRRHPVETYRVATIGTYNVLELARKNPGCRFAYFSSSEIYGDPDPANVPTGEGYRGNVACLGPRATYDSSKRMGETMVEVHHQQYGVDGTIIRPFNVYGCGLQKTDYRVLPNFAARWVAGQPLHVYGDGSQTRTFCYVTDAIKGFLRVLTDGVAGQAYNIGNPFPEISMRDLAIEVGKIIEQEVLFETVAHPSTYPADEPQRRCPKIDKAHHDVGYFPQVSLTTGLTRFFGWAKDAYREPSAQAAE